MTHSKPNSAWGVAGRSGVKLRQLSVWITGEGWVNWRKIERQVHEAHRMWRIKKAEQGVRFYDKDAAIKVAMAK